MSGYGNQRGPGPVPDRWLRCPRKASELIADKFLAFKAPLDGKFDEQVPAAWRFPPSMLFDWLAQNKMKMGLWIDLTRTDRFYDRREIEETGCKYLKIQCHGHDGAPSAEQTEFFIKICKNFIAKEPLSVIGVHCTHGFNRTGFMITSFLVQELDIAVGYALQQFAKARPPGIYKEDYIRELFKRYDDESEAISAPPRPAWCFDEESNAESNTNGNEFKHRNRKTKFKGNPTFMEGIPGVVAITDHKDADKIRQIVKSLTKFPNDGFVGSQPVSMDQENMKFLAQKAYRVSWKADGTRYMMFIKGRGEVYFLDRDNSVFKVNKLQFFRRGSDFRQHLTDTLLHEQHLTDTLLDGEMVIDKHGERCYPRYLVYDVVFINGHNVGAEPFFPNRLEVIAKEICGPRIEAMKARRICREDESFGVRAKPFYEITKTCDLLGEKFAKELAHEPDGLIFQPSEDRYTYGQSPNVLKWKPLSLNSIDFKLKVLPETRIGYAFPYVGHLLTSDNSKFAELSKCNKRLKALDGKIIECKLENGQWIFMRERTDKSFPNSRQTAQAVLNSIRFPVTEGTLLEFIELHRFKDPHRFNDSMPPPKAPPPKRIKTN